MVAKDENAQSDEWIRLPFVKAETNGDMITVMFPNEGDFETDFDADWWNAPYKRGE